MLMSNEAPVITAPNRPNGVRGHAKAFSYDLSKVFAFEIEDLPNLTRRQFAAMPSPFFNGVNNVVGLCSGKQMGRIHAKRIIALMTNLKPLWYRSFLQFVGNSVGKCVVSISFNAAISAFFSDPFPTIRRTFSINPNPKSLFKSFKQLEVFGTNGFEANLTASHTLIMKGGT